MSMFRKVLFKVSYFLNLKNIFRTPIDTEIYRGNVIRERKYRGEKQYLMSWVGYGSEWDSWISAADAQVL